MRETVNLYLLSVTVSGFVATLFSGFVYLLPFDSFSFMFNFKFECSFLQTGLNQETGKLSQIVLQHLSEDLCLSR
jgi:hypothetical protein